MEVIFTIRFQRLFKKLPPDLQEEARTKIKSFTDRNNHAQLKVHKLKGKLVDCYSFSVNYSHRVVFVWEGTDTAVLYAIGDHDIYK